METVLQNYAVPPVLLIVFNRIETVKRTLEAVAQAAPRKIFVAADGPRSRVPGEAEKCREVRDYVLSHIGWDCEVKTRFLDRNAGCRRAVSSAVDWFFSEVEEGIILEDDCLPGRDFFRFAAAALAFYRDDPRIMHINGSAFACPDISPWCAYFYRYAHVWGWASWRRAWKNYDVDLKNFDPKRLFDVFPDDPKQAACWNGICRNVLAEKRGFDTWDFQWTYAIMARGGWCLSPVRNLVSNIGVTQSTHDMGSVADLTGLGVSDLPETLVFPRERDAAAAGIEQEMFGKIYMSPPLWKRAAVKIGKVTKKLFPR